MMDMKQAAEDLCFVADRFKGVVALAERLKQLGDMETLAEKIQDDLNRLQRDREKILAELNRQVVFEANAEAKDILAKARTEAAVIGGNAILDAEEKRREAKQTAAKIIAEAELRAKELADKFSQAREHVRRVIDGD